MPAPRAAHPETLIALPIDTSEGRFIARYSTRGLARLDFPGAGRAEPVPASARVSIRLRGWHRLTTAALGRALAGRAAGRLPPLDWSAATPFQRRVWRALLRLGPGQTWSYGEMARRVGSPKGARAVGGACRANPIPVLVPCHRVLAARGRLGGFSAGLAWKRRLLAREGVPVQ
jgi:O-6-methylguanine DNA methyltransferase